MANALLKQSPPPSQEENVVEFAPLTESDIAAQTDPGSFKRGRGYARTKHIFGAIRRENTLRARCRGSSGGPYLVEATLARPGKAGAKNPAAFACDCPRGGFCKHVVALLLTWIDAPASFEVRPPVADLLAGRSHEALVALIEQMLGVLPELESLLDVPMPVAVAASDALIDEAAIRRQIATALPDEGEQYDDLSSWGQGGRYGYGHDYSYEAPAYDLAPLERIVDLAGAYTEVGHWRNVLRLTAIFVEMVAPELASLQDEGGEIDALLVRCDELLAATLDIQDGMTADERLPAGERRRLFDAILRIWEADIDAGGLSLSERGPAAVVRAASAEEQERAIAAIRDALAALAADAGDRSGEKQAAIAFLALFRGEAGFSDDELLAEYRNAGLWADAAKTLLGMDRDDEAVALAARHVVAPPELTAFADQLLEKGGPTSAPRAIALIDDRLWEKEGQNAQDDQVLRAWLERRYAELGQPAKALELVLDRFKVAPGKVSFDAVRRIALLPDQPGDPWPTLRKSSIATLRKRSDWHVLIDIFLEEGVVDEAIAALHQADKAKTSSRGFPVFGWGGHPQGYTARVAAAAEEAFPDEAVTLYGRLAEAMIAGRSREYYKQAAIYLERVKHILGTTDRADTWPPMIGDLRLRHKSLRALREELDALGLA